MANQLMTAPQAETHEHRPDPTIRSIIDAARAKPMVSRGRGAWWLSFASGALLWAAFTPLNWSPLGWIALVPLILLVRPAIGAKRLYLANYSAGLVSSLVMLQWMRLGDPAMYFAWFALAIYIAVYIPLFVALTRTAVHRYQIPLTLAVPVVWVGLEFARAYVFTGFSWYYLGHTQYRWIELIQISDLVGAYGVSFVVAMANASVAGLIPFSAMRWLRMFSDAEVEAASLRSATESRGKFISVACTVGLLLAVLAYGYTRRSHADFQEGPRVALIQGNFTTSIKHDPKEARQIFERHFRLTGAAVQYQPDLIVWPETMYRDPLMVAPPEMTETDLMRSAPRVPPEMWRASAVPQALAGLSKQAGAALIIGIDTFATEPGSFAHYNSAAFIRPDVGLDSRYDKVHRVLFGEYVPLQDTLPFLGVFSPFSAEDGLTRGDGPVAFQHKEWHYAPIICFEDTVPHLVRNFVRATDTTAEGGAPVDCLINLTNDGWFHGSSELDQHLITALFRCVECRVPMVRAVNTGISAVIDGDGVVVEPDRMILAEADDYGRISQSPGSMRDPATGRWRKEVNAVLVDGVPLDSRSSLYVATGDWFAGFCGVVALGLVLSPMIPARKKNGS
ncbi:MAG: apolipoprotein N-acyltransferase [Planctomycetaceae bacterium]